MQKGANLSCKDKFLQTPLHLAARSGEWELVKYLIESKADPEMKDSEGKTGLDIAKSWGRTEVVEYLEKVGDCGSNGQYAMDDKVSCVGIVCISSD